MFSSLFLVDQGFISLYLKVPVFYIVFLLPLAGSVINLSLASLKEDSHIHF